MVANTANQFHTLTPNIHLRHFHHDHHEHHGHDPHDHDHPPHHFINLFCRWVSSRYGLYRFLCGKKVVLVKSSFGIGLVVTYPR